MSTGARYVVGGRGVVGPEISELMDAGDPRGGGECGPRLILDAFLSGRPNGANGLVGMSEAMHRI